MASVDGNSSQSIRAHRNNHLEEGKGGIPQGNLNSSSKKLNNTTVFYKMFSYSFLELTLKTRACIRHSKYYLQ